MKRIVTFLLAIMLLLPVGAFAGGACTQSAVKCGHNAYQCEVNFTCTGSSVDGNFTSATGMSFNTANLNTLKNYFLYVMTTNPGSTPPTDAYDITLTDAHGDILGGMGSDRSATATESIVPRIDATNSIYGAAPWKTSLTLAITNTTAPSGNVVITFYFVRN